MFKTILKLKSKNNKGIESEREREKLKLEWEIEQEELLIERKEQSDNDGKLTDKERVREKGQDYST